MTDSTPDPPEIDPAALAGASFSRVRKGFEPAEVHKQLGRAADALRVYRERDTHLVERIAELERELAASNDLDEQRITEVLGEETARIVKAARDAAAEIRAKAETEAETLLAESRLAAESTRSAATAEAEELRSAAAKEHEDALAESARLRAEAVEEAARMREEAEQAAAAVTETARLDAERRREESENAATRLREEAQRAHDEMLERASSVLAERTEEAEKVAAGIRETAEAELTAARSEAERIRSEAEEAASEEIERARREGRDMVAEARRVRERMLRDLAERRRTARRQIEAARAGRDRIVDSLRATGATIEDAVAELARVDEEASRAADSAAAAVDDDISHVVAEIETGLRAGAFGTDEQGPDGSFEAVGAGGEIEVDVTEVDVAEVDVAEVDVAEVDVAEVDVVEVDVAEPDADDPDTWESDLAEDVEDLDEGDGDEIDGDEGDGDEEERSPGATVHDLFERIRAERSQREEALSDQTAPPGSAGAVSTATATVPAVAPSTAEPVPASDSEEEADGEQTEVDPVTALLDRRDQLLAPAEKALARTLKRLVSDEQNEVLDRLRRLRKGRPDLDTLIPAGEDVERFVAVLEPEFGAAVGAGERFWDELVGETDHEPHEGPYPRLGSLVTEMLGNRRAHIQKVLDDADSQALDVTEVGDHVRAAYREWRAGPIPELAGDLATAGFAEGVRRAAGPDAHWRWIPDNGGLPCSDAEDNALAGVLRCGEEFPTGDAYPPAHPGCRCILAPAPR